MISQERFEELVKLAGNKLEDLEAVKLAAHESASIWDASGKLPHEEGRYVVIYRQGNIGPKMFIADLYYHAESSEFRWSLGLDNVEILAWLTNVPEYTY